MVDPNEASEYRMWIGNLDEQLTEYALLKILQNFQIEFKKFDYIYQRSGPNKGKPLGFCFLTVSSITEAEKLIKHLDGKRVLGRNISVKPAKHDPTPKNKAHFSKKSNYKSLPYVKNKPTLVDPTITEGGKMTESKRHFTIREIERKLKALEDSKDDVSVFLNKK